MEIVREISWEEVLNVVNFAEFNEGLGNIGISNKGNYNPGSNNYGDRNVGESNRGNGNTGSHNRGDYNSGGDNFGYRNTGTGNKGELNSGKYNYGDNNCGSYNYGDANSGSYNHGDRNNGNSNIGFYNSGMCNEGNWNSGDWNLSDNNVGCFNTTPGTVRFFDQEVSISLKEWRQSEPYKILRRIQGTVWVSEEKMSYEEKEEHPYYKVTGGYLKTLNLKEAASVWWESLSKKERLEITCIPNFDADKFYSITGIEVKDSKSNKPVKPLDDIDSSHEPDHLKEFSAEILGVLNPEDTRETSEYGEREEREYSEEMEREYLEERKNTNGVKSLRPLSAFDDIMNDLK